MPQIPATPVSPHRAQQREHARRLAARLRHLSDQVLIDLARNAPSPAHGRQADEIAGELHATLRVIAALDEEAARREAARRRAAAA